MSIEKVNKPKRFDSARSYRRSFRNQDKAVFDHVARLNVLEADIRGMVQQWDQVVFQHKRDSSLFAAVYHQKPDLLRSVSHWAQYAAELQRAAQMLDGLPIEINPARWNETKVVIEKNMSINPLFVPINGTSLDDISQMALPLGKADIKRIDAVIKGGPKKTKAKQGQGFESKRYIQNVVTIAATQAELYPKFPLSDKARPLLQRLKNYWEFYTTWALKTDSPVDSNLFMMRMLSSDQRAPLLAFIPARLHITPSSTYRLIDAHIENIGFSFCIPFLRRSILYTDMTTLLNGVSPAQGLPQSIARYQLTSVKTEEMLVKKLSQAYHGHIETSGVGFAEDTGDPVQALIKKLSSLYQRRLIDNIRTTEEGFIRIPASENNFFKEILLGSLYGKTLTMIGLTDDEQAFVTLDLIQSGRLFGVPPQLERKSPGAAKLLVQDLLTPVLEEAKARNPLVEYVPDRVKYIPEVRVSQDTAKAVLEDIVKPAKRRASRIGALISGGKNGPDLSTESLPKEQDEKDKHSLVYKDQDVDALDIPSLAAEIASDLLPKDQKLTEDIQLIVEALTEDPYGPGTYKVNALRPITENDQKIPFRSFRGDDRRLLFSNKKYSNRLRAIYYINSDDRSVNLVTIVTHDQFDVLCSKGNKVKIR